MNWFKGIALTIDKATKGEPAYYFSRRYLFWGFELMIFNSRWALGIDLQKI